MIVFKVGTERIMPRILGKQKREDRQGRMKPVCEGVGITADRF
jgi:hypothetical protein